MSDAELDKILQIFSEASEWIKPTDSPTIGLFFDNIKEYKRIKIMMNTLEDDPRMFATYMRLYQSQSKLILSIMDRLGLSPKARKEIRSIIEHSPVKSEFDELDEGVEIGVLS